MKDSLLTENQKKKISALIASAKYTDIIPVLEKVRTLHAGTAKTKDKRFVIREIVIYIMDNSKNLVKDFFKAGSLFCKRTEDNAKEIGVSLIWRGYKHDKAKVREFLMKIADDPNWEVREYAAIAFADTLYCNRDFYKDLIKWTIHPSENIRRAVVFSALGLKEEESLDKAFALLEPLMTDNSKYVKKNLGPFILGSHFGNRFPAETLIKLKECTKLRDANVRWNVIMSFNNSFGNKYPAEALNILKYFTGDVDISVKRALLSTLNFLSKRHKILIDAFRLNYNIDSEKVKF